jgi:hypothetical protein
LPPGWKKIFGISTFFLDHFPGFSSSPGQNKLTTPMAPKIDPYNTPRAKILDALLCLLILTIIALLVLTAPVHRRPLPSQAVQPIARSNR